ncbi:hypothetical protein [Polyangium spumosum]|uniref:DUF4878 domain-containing protein n=1 Tax=Polyangium spumosum TaxID=889282 RepID=A0A6N7PRF2_9BACT|nr:hypothetical protein [Polyangium spumosum]MRG94509.1 hypothetical protein [Polyangium spumosum]
MRRTFALLLVALAASGCMMPQTPTDKLMDAAYDHNTALRFGRMDIAREHVVASAREAWAQRHASWGGRVRVVDLELSDVRMKARDEAEVRVRVEWQRIDEAELRTTELVQKWRNASGWRVHAEECASGDTALLDRPADTAKPKAGSAKDDF